MRPKILIVEDEPAIVDTIQYALATEGFETRCAATGLPVLSTLANETIDLIILDIGLPDIDGFELCRRIRQRHRMPIIFLTARAEEVDRVVGLEIGGDDYVTKPFSPRELSARVKAVLRRTRPKQKPPAAGTGFAVYDPQKKITYRGKPLNLSRYEYEILKTLIHRPGQVFTRELIMEMVWEDPAASMDRTVDAHIKNIRAKLKAIDPEHDPIVTHRGVGYSLDQAMNDGAS
jgi:two-component system catabolic regulation response regulator CreB